MNKHAIQHIVDSSYCFPISPNQITLRLRTAKNDIEKVWVIYESKYVIADRQVKVELERQMQGRQYDYYSVTLDLTDTRIGYVFYIFDGEKYYYFSEDGLTDTYDFAIGYYNFFQYPYINTIDIMQQIKWTENAVFYQIFVDRFNLGNQHKNKDYINCKWGDIPNPKTFAGGDLRGIINRLDYIKDLGVNAIYLTPIFKSISNHKYDISDYWTVDKQFGSNQDLKELVKIAHAKGIRIVLDAVFNHCSDDLKEFVDVKEKGKDSKYYDWFVIHGDKPDLEKKNYEMFASCEYMPKLNTSNPSVQKFLCDIGCYYIREYDIDGWRLDVSDEVSHEFWRNFRRAIKEEKSDCIIIGENWHDASNYLRGDQYDSIMNYAFTKLCLDYFAKNELDAKDAAGKLNDIMARNTDIVNSMLLNLLDSHDTHRFFSEVKGSRSKMAAALAVLFMYPGMPCIFYGTEFYTPGGYDPDCRRCMDWDGYEDGKYDESVKLIQSLSLLRQKYDLASMKTKIFEKNEMLIIQRIADKVVLTLCVNMTDEIREYEGTKVPMNGHKLIESMR